MAETYKRWSVPFEGEKAAKYRVTAEQWNEVCLLDFVSFPFLRKTHLSKKHSVMSIVVLGVVVF